LNLSLTPLVRSPFSSLFHCFGAGCYFTGDGGVDGDIVLDENGRYMMVYKDARGIGEGIPVESVYRGIRAVPSSTSSPMGPYLGKDVAPFLAPTLVEAPEFYPSPDGGIGGVFLAFDCSFWPVPDGWPRAPFGLAHGPSVSSLNFTTLPGACTANTTDMAWPPGATHGSFVCITDEELRALQAAFPSD
jgi:hypothetical protein